jgi:solute carrier family 25 protein 39/40
MNKSSPHHRYDKHQHQHQQQQQHTSTTTNTPYWIRIVSGSVGSIMTAFAVTPLEVVKVRQQSQLAPTTPANVTPCPRGCGTFVFHNGLGECLLPKNAVPYFDKVTGECLPVLSTRLKNCMASSSSSSKGGGGVYNNLGTFSMVRRIFATEGLAGIYAGLAPTLVMGVPNTVLYFITYEELASRLRSDATTTTNNNGNTVLYDAGAWAPPLAGGAARFIASASTAPLELIRTRQSARIGSDQPAKGMMDELAAIVRTDGMPALYKGLSPTLFRDVPFSAVYWFCIERMREEWRRRDDHIDDQQPISALRQAGQGLVNGSVSGMIAAACTTPLDVVKTRRQTEFFQINTAKVVEKATAVCAVCDHEGAAVYNPSSSSKLSSSSTNGAAATTNGGGRGTLQMMNGIFRDEGVRGLWKGNQARMIKVAPACAIMISSYELGKRLLSEEI